LKLDNCKPFNVYIITNAQRTVLYAGVTNDLAQRLKEHYLNKGTPKSFAGKYYCYHLIYFEEFEFINDAISREKEIKGWIREKKIWLINTLNPTWKFLNKEICGFWPPKSPSP
jgi:putative endonuclease